MHGKETKKTLKMYKKECRKTTRTHNKEMIKKKQECTIKATNQIKTN